MPPPPPERERWRTPPADGATWIMIPVMVLAAAFAAYGIPVAQALPASPGLASAWVITTTGCLVSSGILRKRNRRLAVVLLGLGIAAFFSIASALIKRASPRDTEERSPIPTIHR